MAHCTGVTGPASCEKPGVDASFLCFDLFPRSCLSVKYTEYVEGLRCYIALRPSVRLSELRVNAKIAPAPLASVRLSSAGRDSCFPSYYNSFQPAVTAVSSDRSDQCDKGFVL